MACAGRLSIPMRLMEILLLMLSYTKHMHVWHALGTNVASELASAREHENLLSPLGLSGAKKLHVSGRESIALF